MSKGVLWTGRLWIVVLTLWLLWAVWTIPWVNCVVFVAACTAGSVWLAHRVAKQKGWNL